MKTQKNSILNQKNLLPKQLTSEEIILEAQSMNCDSFRKKHEKHLEWDVIENILDFNEGSVNLIYQGLDLETAILFCDGRYSDASLCE
jgi:hypothetical protein